MTRLYAHKTLLRAALAAVAVSASLVCTELLARHIDGYSLASWRLIRVRLPRAPIDTVTASYVEQVAVASSVNRSWFADDPREATGGNPADPALAARSAANRGLELSAVYQWNLEFLRGAACAADPSRYQNVMTTVFPVGEVFVPETVSPENLRWHRRASDRARALLTATEALRMTDTEEQPKATARTREETR